MNIIPWRRRDTLVPFNNDFQDIFERFMGKRNGDSLDHLPELFSQGAFPPVNVSETEDSFCVSMDCPGLQEEDFDVETMGNQLLISGERKWEQEKQGKEFRRVESQFGKFERTVQLPANALTNPSKIVAAYKNGILSITVPKLEKTPTAKIKVHAK